MPVRDGVEFEGYKGDLQHALTKAQSLANEQNVKHAWTYRSAAITVDIVLMLSNEDTRLMVPSIVTLL